jgi:formyl-CoA transferase
MRTLLDSMLVIDLTQFEAGTSYTQMLAWFGARVIKEVIKVESPQTGEPGRQVGRPTNKSADGVFFFLHNTSKKSITLNLQHRQGQDWAAKASPAVPRWIRPTCSPTSISRRVK